MLIAVGSRNAVKIQAVKKALSLYESFWDAKVVGMDVLSGVSAQPTSIEETIHGATNRAKNAFQRCEYSVGLEDGLLAVPSSRTGYMNVCACILYDGKHDHLGLSSGFEYPPKVLRLVFEEGLEISQAFYQAGLTKDPMVKHAEGAVGILTKGRLSRRDYTAQAVMMALVSLENPQLYEQE
ncbi:MAG: inosine/xanthosine triphosphatase [Nanoarchaeota archaeon]|nr:inosine/xanthosine triphosphatase [Nanoarchaeota archaeon]